MLRLRQVKLSIYDNDIKKKVSKLLKVNINEINNIKIVKRSLDARDKNDLLFVYELDIDINNEDKVLNKNKKLDLFKSPNEEYKFVLDKKVNNVDRPIIVGAGPAGLFCAYLLSEYGFNPLIIERGEKVEDRVKTIGIVIS